MSKLFGSNRLNGWRWLVLLLLCLLPLSKTLAHGGGELQVGNVPIGSYLVSVWVNPPTVQTGQVIHITVGIANESDGGPVLDAKVDVQIVDEDGLPVATAVATTEQSVNRLFYEADLQSLPAGAYEMQVMVTGTAGEGDIAFNLEVIPRLIWPWVVGAPAVLLLMGWLVRSWRQGAVKEARRKGTAVPRRRSVD